VQRSAVVGACLMHAASPAPATHMHLALPPLPLPLLLQVPCATTRAPWMLLCDAMHSSDLPWAAMHCAVLRRTMLHPTTLHHNHPPDCTTTTR
jgi:hypothetical protein